MAGVPLPITTHILQAFVTEPVKPFLDVIIVSSQMHVYVSQTDRGEFLIGAEIEPYTTYKGVGTFPFLEYSARHVLELFPQLEQRADPAHVDGPLRPLARLQPDPRQDRGRELPHLDRLGHVRLQGRADRGHDACRAGRDRKDPGADRAVRARALLHGRDGVRAGRRGRVSLARKETDGDADAVEPGDRAGGRAPPDHARSPSEAGLEPDEFDLYGKYKAKVDLSVLERLQAKPDAKLICVTAITPTKAGEGKTTTSVSLTQGLGHIGKDPCSACARPRSGPCSGSRAAPRAAATRRSCRWRT